MALKQPLSSVLGATDVQCLMDAFEEMSSCSLFISFSVMRKGGKRGLQVSASAFTKPPAGVAPVLLAYVASNLSALNTASLEGAAMHILYLLDGTLARQETDGTQPK